VPTCCSELADHSGALPHERACCAAASPSGTWARISSWGGPAAPVTKAHLGLIARALRVAAGSDPHRHDRARARTRSPAAALHARPHARNRSWVAARHAGSRARNCAQVGAPRTRKRPVATSSAHTPLVPTPSTINLLTALSCGRTFHDSAVMTASNCRRRSSHTDLSA
jgi:hypothetical protein